MKLEAVATTSASTDELTIDHTQMRTAQTASEQRCRQAFTHKVQNRGLDEGRCYEAIVYIQLAVTQRGASYL